MPVVLGQESKPSLVVSPCSSISVIDDLDIGFDSETTGVDWAHASRPYMFMSADSNGDEYVWNGQVDPYTREVYWDPDDLIDFRDYLLSGGRLIGHNVTFDMHMVDVAFEDAGLPRIDWPFERIRDTMSTAHMLGSSSPKDLTSQVANWLKFSIRPQEKGVAEVTKAARDLVKRKSFIEEHGAILIAKKDVPGMPSAGDEAWKADMWLPPLLVQWVLDGNAPADILPRTTYNRDSRQHIWNPGDDPKEHPWFWKLSDYATMDPAATLALHEAHIKELCRRGYHDHHLARIGVTRTAYRLETNGLTLSQSRRGKLDTEYGDECKRISDKTIKFIPDKDRMDKLPKGTSKALKAVLFEDFGLVAHKRTSSGSPQCTDKEVIAKWMEELSPRTAAYRFLEGLQQFRQRTTAHNYLRGYHRYWRECVGIDDFYRLFPFLNYYGPRTLRTSSSQPNEQNISKKQGFNLRYAFGPATGRGWAAIDYANQELRIPAYASGEADLIRLFEEPDAPPYYGSNHLLNFETVYPDKWAEALKQSSLDTVAKWIKKNWKPTWYQRAKNGGFAVQYGSVDVEGERLSTADRAFGRKGCHALLKQRFSALESENQRCISEAERTGFVETLPDRTVPNGRGYPLQCERNDRGEISPTQPFNTFVQGTACWITTRATHQVEDYLDSVNADYGLANPFDLDDPYRGCFVTAQIHDEIIIDFPKVTPRGSLPYEDVIKTVQGIMEGIGEDVNVPMVTDADIIFESWSEAE